MAPPAPVARAAARVGRQPDQDPPARVTIAARRPGTL